jgi:hypothetical protein
MALCVAPVAMPLLAAGLNSIVKASAASAPTAVAEPPRPAPLPMLRPAMDNPLFSPAPIGPEVRLEPRSAAPAVQALARPRLMGTRTFRNVAILDGLQLGADGMVVALAGVEPVPQGSECKRLDGVVEPCAQRAANRLEILTRGRPVVCEMQESEAGAVRGACRAGKIDLADDLVRNGLAVRASVRL